MEDYNFSVADIIQLRRDRDDRSNEQRPSNDGNSIPRGRGRGLKNAADGFNDINKSLDEIIIERGIKKPHNSKQFNLWRSKSSNDGENDSLKTLDEIIAEKGITKPQETRKVISPESRRPIEDQSVLSKSLDEMIVERGLAKLQDPRKVVSPGSKNPIEDQSDLLKSLDEIIVARGIVKPREAPLLTSGEDNQKKAELEQPVMLLHQGGQRPPKKIKLRPIDPCTNALDDIIQEVQDGSGNRVEPAGGRCMPYKRKFGSDDSIKDNDAVSKMSDGPGGQRSAPSLTPYRAVGHLSKKGMIVEMKMGRLTDDAGDRSHLWRCVITCGAITGIADSIRKAVAREMASVQFLQQIREVYKDCRIPNYEVFDELFIDPRIVRALEKEVGERCLNMSDEVRVRPMKSCDGQGNRRIHYYLFVCSYYVGTETFKAESHLLEYAKLAAARNAFVGITEREVYPTKFFTGEECDPSLEYTFSESESHLTVTRLEDSDQGKISKDLDEEKREVARTTLSERFKKAKMDEENGRRNMIVDVGQSSENYMD